MKSLVDRDFPLILSTFEFNFIFTSDSVIVSIFIFLSSIGRSIPFTDTDSIIFTWAPFSIEFNFTLSSFDRWISDINAILSAVSPVCPGNWIVGRTEEFKFNGILDDPKSAIPHLLTMARLYDIVPSSL